MDGFAAVFVLMTFFLVAGVYDKVNKIAKKLDAMQTERTFAAAAEDPETS